MLPVKPILWLLLSFLPVLSLHAGGIRGPDHGVVIPDGISHQAIPVCHGFGCRTRITISLSESEWDSIVGWFREPAATPEIERDQIRRAIGWMEVVIGRNGPTHMDLPADRIPESGQRAGQLDCIDESVNTTAYLRLFEQYGYLRHHVVIKEAYRRALIDQHWASQIREKSSGNRFVVDSWFQPNGYLPIIQDSESWEDITLLSAVVDNRPLEKEEE